MKKLGKKLHVTNETLKAYCGCACITGCQVKCACTVTSTAYANQYNTSVSNVYSTSGTSVR